MDQAIRSVSGGSRRPTRRGSGPLVVGHRVGSPRLTAARPSLRSLAWNWQPKSERGALPWDKCEIDRPPVLADDPLRDEQPQPRSLLLGREVRPEDALVLAGSIPAPSSRTDTSTRSSIRVAKTSISPPFCVASIALRTRLRTTCTNWSRTPNRTAGRRARRRGSAALGPLVILGDVQRLVDDLGEAKRVARCWPAG